MTEKKNKNQNNNSSQNSDGVPLTGENKIKSTSEIAESLPWEVDNEPVCVGNCKLCNSKFREEAEEMFDRVGTVKRVYQFLVNDRNEDISYGAVANHIKFHYVARNNDQLVKEYAGMLEEWLGMQKDQYNGLVRAMAMLEREMMTLASLNESLTLNERRKTDDTISKMSDLLLKYRSRIQEMEKDQEPVTLVFNQLRIILNEEMQDVKSEETKQVVSNVLEKLKKSCSEFVEE